ncbi:probable dolichyl pyrophosphate Glc1Man9GlcNAc2 alpha-1,3-glucosyltransferase [Athalia rosae]|uniref:probable dolichyl pyrophosphate Glc1Man9GlcNAc2 alpha-1,3-glucosyltransferase n=1 Tax=Athalia rosae TaxID=37344 RepID=UPI002034A2B2|nr:probable dolichyl pyrophosphate Glc1Man9GlcNAc2 alpha-1,3-glucosyltransferase [Athalia rosae]XP_048511611.1 probable dolichyl pyrophosphate Glc1Man9GlcNAc2 alpha-1,3-glucosyltransferase [Athalia rosae]XP_048511612.1 probable dolichyl pyrophosphate Glc1Man9GlcNAc2 alpha-1,3-glucosyltransferase [Athalia rosae]XP_048511613.1 probable dolichyl pyrophosphate Glc1Man9GlcNAc2 alpha-1,3-glucosyltransferase [Athalia rosae]
MSSNSANGFTKNIGLSNKNLEDKPSGRSNQLFWMVCILTTCVKVLLFPTYHSTDFEVHRNWLAITHSLPLDQWYINAKSQWTLDYPPFFAWFEYFLSYFAQFVDPKMLDVNNLEHISFGTKIFQRTTVIFADSIYAYGIKEISQTFHWSEQGYATLILLALCNVGLLIVDHIHFQYNGFLLGVLMVSISRVTRISEESQLLQGAFWFAVLLNLKHLYIYVAPAFIVWLLRWYCFKDRRPVMRIFKLGSIVLITVAFSFGPFVKQLPQVMTRLFPFKRGLVHAYWAANAWALYTGFDKVLLVIWKRLDWLTASGSASMTGGLVQEYSYAVLPTPTPLATLVITFISMLPALWNLFTKKTATSPQHFTRCVVLCALTSFMFGWHVHEKAILTAIIPLCALATIDALSAKIFIILSAAGHTALLPLLHQINLAPLRILLLLVYTLLSIATLSSLHKKPILKKYELFYITVLPLLPIYETGLHKLVFSESLPFLPLALTSLYCAIGVTYCWLYYYIMLFKDTKRTFVSN